MGLGFSSLGAYARERLGRSLSSVEHRITLPRAADRHPILERSFASGGIGCEAGLLGAQVLGRSASEDVARAWVERARRRTIEFLREEVRVVLGRSASEHVARAWVERARRRTIEFLREEVRVVAEAATFSPGSRACPPTMPT